MKPEAQRIAIAEACGWKIQPVPEFPAYPFPAHTVTKPTGEFLGTISDEAMFKKIPDYLNDLNAAQSAVLSQGEVFVGQFSDALASTSNTIGRRVAELEAKEWAAIFLHLKGLI